MCVSVCIHITVTRDEDRGIEKEKRAGKEKERDRYIKREIRAGIVHPFDVRRRLEAPPRPMLF